MKRLFTMVMVLGIFSAFAQTGTTLHQVPLGHQKPVYFHNVTKHLMFNPQKHASLTRSESACDSFDLMDYGSYAEVIGTMQQGLNSTSFYGVNNGELNNGNPIYIQEMSSQVTAYSASNNDLSYVGDAYDTLAFQDYPSSTVYSYPLASSTITLEGINFFYAYGANEADGDSSVLNDSLLFEIYAINNAGGVGTIALTPDTTVIIAGDSLVEFVNGDSIGLGSVPVGYTFHQGQGFFIKMVYINKDTSTHFSMCMTFVDSCGPITITYQGMQYQGQIFAGVSPLTSNVQYPAAPLFGTSSPNTGLAFFGSIIDDAADGLPLAAYNQDNTFGYANSGITPTLPYACQFTTSQNWAILPIIDVCQSYSAQIQASSASACPNGSVSLTGGVTGSPGAITVIQPDDVPFTGSFVSDSLHYGNGNNPNLTYNWSASAGSLIGSSTSTPALTMPQNGNVTVTMNVSDGVADTTASIVITNAAVTVSIHNTQPILLTCGGSVNITTNDGGVTTGHSYKWTGINLDTTNTAASAMKVHYPGTYYVTLTNAAGCTAEDSAVVEYSGVSNAASFTAPNPICENMPASFTNTSTSTNGWTAAWTFGDPAQGTSSDISPTYTYTQGGSFHVQLVMDSSGCLVPSTIQTVTVYTPLNNHACVAGITDIGFDNSINIMPNPSTGNISMVINGVQNSLSIRVYNILGSEVVNYSASDMPASVTKDFDLSNFASGTYLVKIQSGEQIAVKRLVIAR